METQSSQLAELAHRVSSCTRAVLTRDRGPTQTITKADGSLVTKIDVSLQRTLRESLREFSPETPFLGEELSEESQQDLLRHSDRGVWCVDPLDGTTNFVAGLPYFATSVCLIRDGRPELGVIYDPSRNECFTAEAGAGVWLNAAPLAAGRGPSSLSDCLALVDFKRLPAALAASLAAQPPYRSQRSFGSIALDWCWIAARRCHLYLHGSQRIWDLAAGVLILDEAGGAHCSLDASEVWQLSLQPTSVAAATHQSLLEDWMNVIRERCRS